MNDDAAAQRQRELAQTLASLPRPGWTRIEARGTVVAGVGGVEAFATSPTTRESLAMGPAMFAVLDLQHTMYQPGKGTWFSFTCTIESSGEYRYTFNHDEYVPFADGRVPPRDAWITELRRHPRPWYLIPDWHPVKHDYTEQQWADEIAAHEASTSSHDPTGADLPEPDQGNPLQRAAELQTAIAQACVAAASPGWQSIDMTTTAVAGVGSSMAWARRPDGDESLLLSGQRRGDLDLQDAMYQPGTGSWFSFTCTIDADGAFHFTFNYDDHVPFPDGREPLRDSWIKELRRHPRDWHHIPDWHPVRQDYTEQQWADDIAAYEASDDYSDPTGRR